ncbi:MAG: type II toxin-antitoxin system VapC family toxin [Candidatus Bathyarchaeia archaeon]
MKSGDGRLLKIRRYTFDTGPLFLYFGEDLRVKRLLDEVRNGRAEGSTCEPNLAELYYKTCEKLGRETARIRYFSIRRAGLSVLAPNENLSRSAGELKCRHRGRLSIVDAYVLAIAIEERATLITSDPQIPELELVPTRLIEAR